jgi:hypothetical protein
MLRTNLSTKPFYNERAIHAALAVAAVIVATLTMFNLTQIVLLTRQQSELSSHITAAENRARQLRADAVSVRQGIDQKQLETVAGAAREANTLIGLRLFSWTDLLNRLETTLPADVRILSMHPRIDKDGTVTVLITAVGRRVEDIDRFMENLEATGAFADVFSKEETATDDGLRQVLMEGRYLIK